MILRLSLALVAAALLFGCQTKSAEQQWSKSGATAEDVKRDLYWCTTSKRTPQAEGTPATARPPTEVVDDDCMENRGYTKSGSGK